MIVDHREKPKGAFDYFIVLLVKIHGWAEDRPWRERFIRWALVLTLILSVEGIYKTVKHWEDSAHWYDNIPIVGAFMHDLGF